MSTNKKFWVTIALANLCILALLGVILRSKILFPLEMVDFKNVLHAHSHYAFAGWISLALMSLMVADILPANSGKRRVYQFYLAGILSTAVGMLISFVCQGYAFFSILFSTLFIFVSYGFSFIFIRDILRSGAEKAIKVLSVAALICLVLSSIGPFTLAYIVASHSNNSILYRDSIYTYLHFQYNGFFTLAVFALLFNNFYKKYSDTQLRNVRRFAWVLSASIIPALFITYLWHVSNIGVRLVAIGGIVLIALSVVYLLVALRAIRDHFDTVSRFVRNVGSLSVIAFLLKSLLQTGTIFPALGKMVYGDRAIIIGYLHLVLLGFISLYILAHLLYNGLLNAQSTFTRSAIVTFVGAVITNEVILMVQGFGNMLMISYHIYTWLLWGASIFLFTGAVLIFISRLLNARFDRKSHQYTATSVQNSLLNPNKSRKYESTHSY